MPNAMSAPSFESLAARHGERYKWLLLLVVACGMIAGVLSTTSFSVAIPALTRHFGLGQSQVQWAITGFMAAMTIAMLPVAWLIDRFGFRIVFLSAISVLLISSIAGSLTTSFSAVVAARIVQGAAAGMLQPLGPLAVMRLFPSTVQGRASGVLGFGIVLAPATAPALGGVLLDQFGWHAIFLLDLPFCLLAAVLGLRLLPAPRERLSKPFDWGGMGLLTLITVALIEGVAGLQHSDTYTLSGSMLALAVGAFALFVKRARQRHHPIISIGLFRHPSFSMGSLVAFSYGFGLYASTLLIPVFLQNAAGFSATAAGFALLPSGIALAVVIPIAGRLADRYPPQKLTAIGLALFALSFLLFATFSQEIAFATLILITVIGRIGLGLVLPALNLATLRHLEPRHLGQAAMVTSYLRQVGGVLGIAIAAVFLQWRESIYGTAHPGIFTAYAQSFLLVAGVFLIALVAASRMQAPRPAS